jgi:hypothetical protein
MTNHVHLIGPANATGVAKAIGRAKSIQSCGRFSPLVSGG